MARGDLNDPLLPFMGEPFEGETLMADGWVYRDLPKRLSDEYWDLFVKTLGEDNYRIMIMSVGSGWKRGQFLISPQGMKNLAAYIAKQKE